MKGVSSLCFPEKLENHPLIIAGIYILRKSSKKYQIFKGHNSVNKYQLSIKFGMRVRYGMLKLFCSLTGIELLIF